MAIYAVGEGWTGALTRQHILTTIPGQFDEETKNNSSVGDVTSDSDLPVLIYPHDDIQQATAGWGVSAIIDTQGSFQIVGRPHDLISLLRMNRMPPWLQRWINRNHDTSATTPVGNMLSNFIGWATGSLSNLPEEKETWKIAEKFSLLDDWTKVDIINNTGSKFAKTDMKINQVACGPGFLAIIGESGALYTMGVNNRGQCGTGTTSNNIWIPEPVRGLSMTSLPIGGGDKIGDKIASEQDQPIVQVTLGFQQGYALSKEGQVYSWGKASRGQLGRVVDSDQDPWARPIKINSENHRVVEIGAGFHHGALRTEDDKVFIWGKNMSRGPNHSSGVDDNKDPISIGTADLLDAREPEQILGLPSTSGSEALKVQRISCGSHHTSILMDDGSVFAVGIASDKAIPILDPVELIPSGVLDLPIRHFEAHYDRTSVIDNKGMVYQAHLWNDKTLQDYAYFNPSFVDSLLDEGHIIQSIHRGWRHTIIVTKTS